MNTFPSHTARNLLFHLVDSHEVTIAGSRLLVVTADELAACIESLLSKGLVPTSLQDYLGAQQPGPAAFTISFDDAHPSVLHVAAPVIEELGVSATVFVPTDFVGESDQVLGWRELRELAARPGWSVGSHGAAHQRMSWRQYREDEGEQFARLSMDVLRSRRALEGALGFRPRLFAYPYGEAPPVARRAVAAAGFDFAFTVASSQSWDGDPLGAPRLDGCSYLERGVEGDAVRAPDANPGISVVVPSCDRVEILREVVRRLSEQSYPRERHEVIIVDDGSGRDLERELEGDLWVRVLHLEGSDETFRAGQARQAGADAARFEVIAFLDADVAVDQDYLWHVAYCHSVARGAVVLGYLSGYNLHDLGWRHALEDIEGEERLTGDRVPVIPDRGREPALRECFDDIQRLDEPWRLAYTGNLSVTAELLQKAGGFSDEFKGWGFEDIDLGVRLHQAGAQWIFSRWALGYHLSDEAEENEGRPPRNPFRDRCPREERFAKVLENLGLLETRHPGNRQVAGFCSQVRADVDEICHPPSVVGVEVGADDPFEWPFPRLGKRHPGGLPLQEILERLAYAEKLGASSLYLLGGDVATRVELPEILDAAVSRGAREISIETSALPFARVALAEELAGRGLSSAVVEVLAGCGHPRRDEAVGRGVAALRRAQISVGAKIVLGENDPKTLATALDWVDELGLTLYSVMLLEKDALDWVRSAVTDAVEVEVIEHVS